MKKQIILSTVALLPLLGGAAMAQTAQKKVLYFQAKRTNSTVWFSQSMSAREEYNHPTINFVDKKVHLGKTTVALTRLGEMNIVQKTVDVKAPEVMQKYLGQTTPSTFDSEVADMNQDGKITMNDANIVANKAK